MGELAKIESFRKELALAETIEEIKLIGDAAEVFQSLLKKQGMIKSKIDEIGEFIIEVEISKAEWLNEFYPHGVNSEYRKTGGTKTEPPKMPVPKKESARARKLRKFKDEKPEIFGQIKDKIKKGDDTILNSKTLYNEIKKIEREELIEETKQKIENKNLTITGLYDVVVIDPPWAYGREYDPENSRVANPYPEMSTDEISKIELPIKESAVIFLWTTHAFIRDAFRLVSDWGFNYKAIITWDKEKMGMGSTIRMQCEFCLLCTKGKPLIEGSAERDIIREARREHSRKPEAFYLMVERITTGRRLDYFSRSKRVNWDSYGAEAEKF